MAVSPDNTSAQAGETPAKAGRAEALLRERASRENTAFRNTGEKRSSPFDQQQELGKPEKAEQPPACFHKSHSCVQAFTDYVKGKFDKENLFGSLFLLALTFNTLQGMIIGMNQQKVVEENGVPVTRKDVDKTRIAVAIASATANMWTFFSSRRGETPDGNNMAERMWDSLKHPNQSQVQARELITLPITLVAVAGHLYYGMNMGSRKNHFPNGKPASVGEFLTGTKGMLKEGKAQTRLYQGGAAIATTVLALSSLFGKEAERKKAKDAQEEAQAGSTQDKKTEKEEAQSAKEQDSAEKDTAFSKSKSKNVGGTMLNPIKVFKVTWEENPKLVVSSALSFLAAVALFIEGRRKQTEMRNTLEDIKDFSSEKGIKVRDTMLEKPKYSGLSDRELINKLPDFKQDQMKESHTLLRTGVIGMALNLCGQVYRASQLGKEAGMAR